MKKEVEALPERYNLLEVADLEEGYTLLRTIGMEGGDKKGPVWLSWYRLDENECLTYPSRKSGYSGYWLGGGKLCDGAARRYELIKAAKLLRLTKPAGGG